MSEEKGTSIGKTNADITTDVHEQTKRNLHKGCGSFLKHRF